MSKIKLIYSEEANQFYKPMRFDEDIGIIYMKIANNRHDKSIKKDDIIRIEENSGYKYVVMHDISTTAEEHFIKIIKGQKDLDIKLKEIENFKKNLLFKSEDALAILIDLTNAKKRGRCTKTKVKISNAAINSYRSLKIWKRDKVNNNKKSYENQEIPNNIKSLALKKRLFIERRDDYCFKAKNTLNKKVAPKDAKRQIQANFPCGFLIRDKGGKIIGGKQGKKYYTFCVEEVIEFVKNYDTSKTRNYTKLYRVPMSHKKEKDLSKCNHILNEHKLHLRNEHNYYFWVLDRKGNVLAGGKNGFGFKWLLKYCRRLQSQPKKKNESVTDK